MFWRLGKEITEKELEVSEDLNNVIYGNGSIYWLIRKYWTYKNQKEIRYKIMWIKRRITDINLIRNELEEIIRSTC